MGLKTVRAGEVEDELWQASTEKMHTEQNDEEFNRLEVEGVAYTDVHEILQW